MLTTCLFVSIAYSWCFQPVFEIKPVATQVSIELPIWRAVDFIAPFELTTRAQTYTAYKDTSGRYSIGYGTRSFEWEVITQEEAYIRFLAIVRQSMKKVQKDFPNATADQLIALTSVYYNCGSGYKRLKQEGLHVHKEAWFCQLPGYGWLVKRREAERKLLF